MRVTSLTVSEVYSMLRKEGFEHDIASVLQNNKIDGLTLLELDSEDMIELGITTLGDRKRLQRLQRKGSEVIGVKYLMLVIRIVSTYFHFRFQFFLCHHPRNVERLLLM